MANNTGKVKSEAAKWVPKSREEVAEGIAEIGRHQRERERIQAAMNDEFAELKKRFEEEAEPHNDAIRERAAGVQTWCEANREDLLTGKAKTADFTTGKISWRVRPPSVSLKGVADVLKALKKHKLARFIRTKEEINKDAILAEPKAVEGLKGITIKRDAEDFVIAPSETELEEVV